MPRSVAPDHEKYRALYTLGSTMTFNTLIDAEALANLAISMLIEFTGARRGHLILFHDDGSVRHRFSAAIAEQVREIPLPEETAAPMTSLRPWDPPRERSGGRSLLLAMHAEETLVGAVALERDEWDDPFSPPERTLTEACVAHLAQSLRSRRLYETHLAQRRRIELLDRVTRTVTNPADLEEALALLIRTSCEALGAASGAIVLGDNAGRLGLASLHRMGEDLVDPESHPAESRLLRWVYTEGTPMCDGTRLVTPIRQILRDKRVFGERRRTIHASPFLRTLGVLYLETPLERRPFAEEDLLALGVFADHASTAIANNTLMQQAATDALTRLDSRRQLEIRLVEECEFARRHGAPLSLILLDVDHFKRINDGHGHQAGDEVLAEIAHIVREAVRRYDVCARYGGEEFVVLLPETHLAGAQVVAENIRRRVEGALFSRARIPATVSLGVAEHPLHANTPEGLLRRADRALYEAKASGRNCIRTAGALG